jgi:60 kDa SS-A/Ro ribonucleoprotein
MSSFNSLSNSVGNRKVTAQTTSARADQVKNNAGGFVFGITPLQRLDRFLIIGSQGGTYYQGERDITKENTDSIIALIKANGKAVVNRVVEISQAGRAKNNDYAIYAMALVMKHGDDATKAYAKDKVQLVCRTGTHLFHFVAFANGVRGWGRSLKSAVQTWYNSKTTDQLAYQVVKYKQRDGWSHRDVLRLAHVNPGQEPARQSLYKYLVKGSDALAKGDLVPPLLVAVEQAKTASKGQLIQLITDYNLTHEMIPNEMKNEADVWAAMLPKMGLQALIRNLNKMTALDMIKPLSSASRLVMEKLGNEATLRQERMHPMSLLIAMRQYAKGHGDKGSLTWTPDRQILVALEQAFYASFQHVEPTGLNYFLGLDISGSMGSAIPGAPQISCAEGAAVMAMATVKKEPYTLVMGFARQMVELKISASDSLDAVLKETRKHNFGTTDCAAPMVHALQQRLDVDVFSIYTDNETYAGKIHPFQAMKGYRNGMNKPEAKLIVCGMTVSNFSIADPSDAGMLDVVGFDSATPRFISEFSAGRL